MTEPTDAELDALIASYHKRMYPQDHQPRYERAIMRAAVAQWGQPAQAAEPVAWRVARSKVEYELFFYKLAAERRAECFTNRPRVEPLFTAAPQPVAREPLEPCMDGVEGINARLHFRRGWKAAEQAHGIKGGPHGTE